MGRSRLRWSSAGARKRVSTVSSSNLLRALPLTRSVGYAEEEEAAKETRRALGLKTRSGGKTKA